MSINIKKELEKAITDLCAMPHVKKGTLEEFSKRVENGGPFTKLEHAPTHFCSFFIPYHVESQSIYVVHHKKANDWIPPGGHLDPDESPLQTVRREYYEELGVSLHNERILLVDASIKDITHPHGFCNKHYDFWYAVASDKIDFVYDKDEFYDAGWYPIDFVWQSKTRSPMLQAIFKQLAHVLRDGFTASVVQ